MQLFNQVKEKGKEKNQKLLQNEHVFSLLHSNKKKKPIQTRKQRIEPMQFSQLVALKQQATPWTVLKT